MLLIWAVARLPLLAIALFLFKEPFLALMETLGGFETLVTRTIFLQSTGLERLLCFGGVSLFLTAIAALMSQWAKVPPRQKGFFGPVGIRISLQLLASFGLLWGLFTLIPTRQSLGLASLLTGILAANALPTATVLRGLSHRRGRWLAHVGFGLAIGLGEILLLKPFLLWLRLLWQNQPQPLGRSLQRLLNLLPILTVSALAACALGSQPLVDWGQQWHGVSPAVSPTVAAPIVQKIATGNFNSLALNPRQHTLYVGGHGVNVLRAYDTHDLTQAPRLSTVNTNYAQSFAYSPVHAELYVYSTAENALQVIDASTLRLRQSIPVPQLASGDVWITWDAISNRILLASEADAPSGKPFVVIDRTTGQVVQALDLNAGNIFRHPRHPWLYLSSFRRTQTLLRYDIQQSAIARQVSTDPRVHRMAWDNTNDELLLASSVRSTILRYSAETLEFRGSIPTVFSVRSVAVDPDRHLLLTGGLATNRLEVIDLTTHQKITDYYLGPWLREICIDADAGVAYVSANGALYRVNYLAKLK
jgi:DNA-binding beta-propeller fold protein YncE